MLANEGPFFGIHNEITPTPTPRQSQVEFDIALSQLQRDDKVPPKGVIPHTITTNKQKKKNARKGLFLHFTYETRLKLLKQDLKEIYQNVFRTTPIANIQIIVGSRNNPKSKTEFIKSKRPHPRYRRHDFKPSKLFIISYVTA
ncbi:unnamed protein product [Rotaria sp. Silwood1]|nr:unnamed protein product [Rotaria sp. Silwood1]